MMMKKKIVIMMKVVIMIKKKFLWRLMVIKREEEGDSDLQPLLNVFHRGCGRGGALKFWSFLYLRLL